MIIEGTSSSVLCEPHSHLLGPMQLNLSLYQMTLAWMSPRLYCPIKCLGCKHKYGCVIMCLFRCYLCVFVCSLKIVRYPRRITVQKGNNILFISYFVMVLGIIDNRHLGLILSHLIDIHWDTYSIRFSH